MCRLSAVGSKPDVQRAGRGVGGGRRASSGFVTSATRPRWLEVPESWCAHRLDPVASIIARPRGAPFRGRAARYNGPTWHPIRSVRGRAGVSRSWAADGGLRWLLIVAGIGSLLVGAGVARGRRVGVHHPARARCPRSARLETLPAASGRHQDLRRQRRADHRAPRRARGSSCRSPRCPRPSATPSSPPRTAASTTTGASIPIGIARAVVQNYRRGRIVEGGSTITQQLTKVLFLTPDKSLERKLKEAVLALELERRYSEGPHPRDVPEPGLLRPRRVRRRGRGPDATSASRSRAQRARSRALLRRLAPGAVDLLAVRAPARPPSAGARSCCAGWWTTVRSRTSDAKRAGQADLGLIPPERRRTTGQYFLDYVQQTLEAKYGADLVFKGGLERLHDAQSDACSSPPSRRCATGSARRSRRRTQKAAGPVSHPEGAHRHHRAPDRLRPGHGRRLRLLPQRVQPRRAGPPAAGLGLQALHLRRRAGGRASPPATRIEDAPVSHAVGANGRPGSPRTTTESSAARRRCSRRSKNPSTSSTVKLQERVGISRTIQVARRLGIASPLDVNLSLALGTSDLTLLELTLGLRRARQPGHLDAADRRSAT